MTRGEYLVREAAIRHGLESEGAEAISLGAVCRGMDNRGTCYGANTHCPPELYCTAPEEHHTEFIIGISVEYYMPLDDSHD